MKEHIGLLASIIGLLAAIISVVAILIKMEPATPINPRPDQVLPIVRPIVRPTIPDRDYPHDHNLPHHPLR